jgi:hypothetical protein
MQFNYLLFIEQIMPWQTKTAGIENPGCQSIDQISATCNLF